MSDESLRLFLVPNKKNGAYQLLSAPQNGLKHLTQIIDFADRKNSNNDYYPSPIMRKEIDRSNGFIFVSEPLQDEILINGSFGGELLASINKRDMDFGVTLYELTPAGDYFNLAYVIDRASFVHDPSNRQLLTPHQLTRLPLTQTKLISKRLEKGSRLVAYLNINKNPFSQLNYGTGKDVSDESIKDAKKKLVVKWFEGSFLSIPILHVSKTN